MEAARNIARPLNLFPRLEHLVVSLTDRTPTSFRSIARHGVLESPSYAAHMVEFVTNTIDAIQDLSAQGQLKSLLLQTQLGALSTALQEQVFTMCSHLAGCNRIRVDVLPLFGQNVGLAHESVNWAKVKEVRAKGIKLDVCINQGRY